MFPRRHWLVERMQMSGLDVSPIMQVNTFRGVQSFFKLEALVRISAGRVNVGPLTNWSSEEELLARYCQFPLDSYSVQIQEVWKAWHTSGDPESLRVFFRESRRGVSGIAEVSNARPLVRLRSEDLEGVLLRKYNSRNPAQPVQDVVSSLQLRCPGRIVFNPACRLWDSAGCRSVRNQSPSP